MSVPSPRKPGPKPKPVPEALREEVFTYPAARAAGVTRRQLAGLSYERLHRAVYADAQLPTTIERTASAWMLALPPDAAMYGRTAATWYGLPIGPAEKFQIIVPPGTVPRRRPGLDPHEGLGPDDTQTYRGLRVTTPGRTWLDLSLTLNDTELVVVGDAMARRHFIRPPELVELTESTKRRRGIVRARALARLVRDRVDSPQETRLRLMIVSAGYPCPDVNLDVYDEYGGWIGRPDLSYIEIKLALQYEGDLHRTDRKRWRADIGRDEILRDHGWDIIRVTADDLQQPRRLIQRLRRAIERQRQRHIIVEAA